jgi:dTDP-4-dehydrorhamnose reductase
MRILITGGSGRIATNFTRFLLKTGNEVLACDKFIENFIQGSKPFRLDITERQPTIDLIEKLRPEIVIHTAALTNVDLCETDKELANKINVQGTMNIVDACKKVNNKIVYISTSAVFDGSKKIYTEEDTPNPTYYYALTKFEGEKIVSNSVLPFLILRTDQPYCWIERWQKDNSVARVIKKLEADEIIKEPVDWYNNPTLVDNFVEVAFELIKKNKTGIYHVVGSDFLNRYELALKIAEIFDKNKELIEPIKSGDLKLPVKRVNVNLDNRKAQKDSGIKLLGVEEGLKILLKQK